MKKIFLISIIVLLTSFKTYNNDAGLHFDHEVTYIMDHDDFSVFVSKSNSKDFLLSVKDNDNVFVFLQNTKLFKLRISNLNDIDWSGSVYDGDPSDQEFNEIVETTETKIINNLKCTRFIAKSPIIRSQSIEVYIAKDNKINNVNFLFSLRTRANAAVKGLVTEINLINDKTSDIRSVLKLKEIKPTKKTLKVNDENLKVLIEKYEYHKNHKVDNIVIDTIDEK